MIDCPHCNGLGKVSAPTYRDADAPVPANKPAKQSNRFNAMFQRAMASIPQLPTFQLPKFQNPGAPILAVLLFALWLMAISIMSIIK